MPTRFCLFCGEELEEGQYCDGACEEAYWESQQAERYSIEACYGDFEGD